MSLAQRVERPQPVEADRSLPGNPQPRVAIPVDFRDITRRPASPGSIAAVPSPASSSAVHPAADRAESNLAFELLNEVSKALPALVERAERLEADLQATREAASAEIEAAHEVAREWQQIAHALKLQVDGLEKGMAAMKQRAEAAESRAGSLRDETDRAQHAAAEAECLSSLFQEKVISAFGINSQMNPILETLRLRGGPQTF